MDPPKILEVRVQKRLECIFLRTIISSNIMICQMRKNLSFNYKKNFNQNKIFLIRITGEFKWLTFTNFSLSSVLITFSLDPCTDSNITSTKTTNIKVAMITKSAFSSCVLRLHNELPVWYRMWVADEDTPPVSCTLPMLLMSSSANSACLYLVICKKNNNQRNFISISIVAKHKHREILARHSAFICIYAK